MAGLLLSLSLVAGFAQTSISAADARKPEIDFLRTYIKAGGQVLDLGANKGFMSSVFSDIVGASGHVDLQNPAEWVESRKIAPILDSLKAARSNLSILTVDFEHIPVPNKLYDVAYCGTIYHDTFNMPGHSEAQMDQAIFNAIKTGGYFIVTDHQAEVGSGSRDTKTLHRIDKQVVIDGVTKAGFKLVLDSPLLNSTTDDTKLAIFNPAVRGHTNRFTLVFQKP